MTNSRKIAILLYRLKFGGAERVMLALAGGFAERGFSVDVVVFKAAGEFADKIPPVARLVDLGSTNMFKALPKLSKYLGERAPEAIIANGDRCTLISYLAKKTRTKKPKILSVVHHDLVSVLSPQNDLPLIDKIIARLKKIPMSFVYPRADAIIAVSEGVADSVSNFLGYQRDRVRVIYNPVPTEEIRARAAENVDHEWYAKREAPIVVSAGRLTPQKDFPTLIRAFGILRRDIPAKLAILGEGPERKTLENLIGELGLHNSVELLGFQENPYKYMARADLFVLSSVFEGFGMAIAEAMALGTPVVSTDCPSGPAELLKDHPERLVPMGNPEAMAGAMKVGLGIGREENDMEEFSLDSIVSKYISCLPVENGL
jgi:glycosyltransferase involved in cell wall biosynthesis